MAKSTFRMWAFLFILSITYSHIIADDFDKIKKAIAEKGAKWTAAETWIMKLTKEEQKQLFGAFSKPSELAKTKLLSLPKVNSFPSKFDWRNNNGNWVTPPKNQDLPQGCGSCWAHALVGEIESWWKIHNNMPDSMIDLSEQFLLSCSGGGWCGGADVWTVMDFVQSVGVPTEMCFPYQASDQIPCNNACTNWSDEAVKIPGWGYITCDEATIENIKFALLQHPVHASFDVYEDFNSYSHGVYSHVWGNFIDGHGILIIGWNDDERSWICKNSWGTDWGETINFTPYTPGAGDGGYFRIRWDDCNVGKYVVTTWDEAVSSSAFSYSQKKIDIKISMGDTLSYPLTLYNQGAKKLFYSSMDYQSSFVLNFHPSTFNAYSGESWWCGDTQLGGFDIYWLQYLDLPSLNLSAATNPKLSFMASWSVVNPLNILPPIPFDGWDGCNIWISVDGGKSFEVAVPSISAYNCTSLFSFSSTVWGWNIGNNIAGWTGKSNGWKQVELDLSQSISDSVIIRFAFASSGATLGTPTDSTLYGFLVDDITVTNDSQILFENHGETDTTMKIYGLEGLEKADWLTVNPSTETVEPEDSLSINVVIDTKDLAAGSYYGLVILTSNDLTYRSYHSFSGGIHINLEVQDTVATDIKMRSASIPETWSLEQNYPNPFNPSTKISWQSPDRSHQVLKVFDVLGNEIVTLVNEEKPAGNYEVTWNAVNFPCGVYFYRLQAGSFVETKKMILLK
jgi:C1A family cysteine protease